MVCLGKGQRRGLVRAGIKGRFPVAMSSTAKDGPRVLDSCLAETLGKRVLLIDPKGVLAWGGRRVDARILHSDLAVAAHILTVGSGSSND